MSAIARAAGLTTCRLDGSPLIYNEPDPWLPDLIVCRPELADQIRAALDDTDLALSDLRTPETLA